MAMNIYTDASGPLIEFTVHLDTEQLDADNQPDEAWVSRYAFPAAPTEFRGTAEEWAAQCEREATLLAADELARRQRTEQPRVLGKARSVSVADVTALRAAPLLEKVRTER